MFEMQDEQRMNRPSIFWLTCDVQYCHRSLHSFRTCLLPQVLFTSTMANSPVLVPVKNSVSTTETVSCHRFFILDTLMCRFFVPIRLDPGEIKGAWGPMPVPNDSSKTQHNENRTGYHQIVKIISDSWEISAPIRPLSSCDVAFLCSKSRNHNFREHFAWKLGRPGECTALLPLFVRSGFWVW